MEKPLRKELMSANHHQSRNPEGIMQTEEGMMVEQGIEALVTEECNMIDLITEGMEALVIREKEETIIHQKGIEALVTVGWLQGMEALKTTTGKADLKGIEALKDVDGMVDKREKGIEALITEKEEGAACMMMTTAQSRDQEQMNIGPLLQGKFSSPPIKISLQEQDLEIAPSTMMKSLLSQKSETVVMPMPIEDQAAVAKTSSNAPTEGTKDLKIVFWNCAKGLAGKLLVIRKFLQINKPHLIFVSESEIKNKENFDFYRLTEYDFHLSNTINRGKSRIICYVAKHLQDRVKRMNNLENDGNEIIVFDIDNYRIAGLYLPFKLQENETRQGNFMHLVENLKNMSSTLNGKKIVVGGDFNVNWLEEGPMKSTLQDWSDDFSLEQAVKNITRFRLVETQNGRRTESSLLDHIYLSKSIIGASVEQETTIWSDHDIMKLTVPFGGAPKQKNKKLILRDWRNYTPERLLRMLVYQLEMVDHNIDIDKDVFMEEMTKSFDKLVPLRVVRFKEKKGQIADTDIAKLIKKRDRLLKAYKKENDSHFLWVAKPITKQLKKLIKKKEKEKVQNKLKSPNPKLFWNTIKSMLGRKDDDVLKLKEDDGSIIRDQRTLAEKFAKFFHEKVINYMNSSAETVQRPENQTDAPLEGLTFTCEEIKKAAGKLKNKKCYGSDILPLKVIKNIANIKPEIIKPILEEITRNGLGDELKTARITPLHKKGSKDDVGNYRPISNLSSLGKLYEKVLLERLNQEAEGKEGTFQHAYRSQHSTTTALLELQNMISRHVEDGKFVLIYSMDLSAAFDLLRPEVMSSILQQIQISSGLRGCLEDFLKNRSFYVDINGMASSMKKLPIGCVQGSILGPKLFTLYLGALSEKIGHKDIISYADDSYVVIHGANLEELKEKARNISGKHVEFLRSLGMIVNETKTELMLMHKTHRDLIEFEICGEKIVSGKTLKALGVTFQNDFKWDTHLENIFKKIRSKLAMLRLIGKNLNKEQFLKVASAQLFSIMYYANSVWMNSTLSAMGWKKLRSWHYRILRAAVKDFKYRKSKEQLNLECKRATPVMWHKYSSASLVIKCIRDGSPQLLNEEICRNLYTQRRSVNRGRFFDNSKGKVGRHRLGNRITFMNDLDFDWLNVRINDDRIRIELKRFLNFEFKTLN